MVNSGESDDVTYVGVWLTGTKKTKKKPKKKKKRDCKNSAEVGEKKDGILTREKKTEFGKKPKTDAKFPVATGK